MSLVAPFPFVGSKKRVSSLVWDALGTPSLYVEPFGGSLAVLLARPGEPGGEVVNDTNNFLPNFWRAMRHDPDGLLQVAAQPVTEVDYKARHRWLVSEGVDRLSALGMVDNPDVYDLRVAGWWLWGQRASIGRWCLPGSQREDGTFFAEVNQRPNLDQWNDLFGEDWATIFEALSVRLRRVRVLCGTWERCVTTGALFRHERTAQNPVGIFLDPPYRPEMRDARLYGARTEVTTPLVVNDDVEAWCRASEGDERLRIVLAGLEGEYDLPEWRQVAWRAPSASERNKDAERLWLSPSCASESGQIGLF